MNVIKPLEIGENRYVVIDWSNWVRGTTKLSRKVDQRLLQENDHNQLLQHTVSTSDDAKSCKMRASSEVQRLMLSKDFSITTAVQSTPRMRRFSLFRQHSGSRI